MSLLFSQNPLKIVQDGLKNNVTIDRIGESKDVRIFSENIITQLL
jgi:hypothetical protein